MSNLTNLTMYYTRNNTLRKLINDDKTKMCNSNNLFVCYTYN